MTESKLLRSTIVLLLILLGGGVVLFFSLSPLSSSNLQTSHLRQVKDINLGGKNAYPAPLVSDGRLVYFYAYDELGRNLWVSDGTESGTHRVKDMDPNSGEIIDPPPIYHATPVAYSIEPEVVNDTLFFPDSGNSEDPALWMSDGTLTNTVLLKDTLIDKTSLTKVQDDLFFAGCVDRYKCELWITDGTEAGTRLVKDIRPGENGSNPNIMTAHDGNLYFFASDNQSRLWVSDGTVTGTRHLTTEPHGMWAWEITSAGDNVYFLTGSDHELWRSDGTITGTFAITNVTTGYYGAAANKQFFFSATEGNPGGSNQKLWVSDGTLSGTHQVIDINPSESDRISSLIGVGDRLFFYADDSEYGVELWVSDGTVTGTHMVKDINPTGDSLLYHTQAFGRFADLNGTLYFRADDGVHGYELWQSDGTEEGTFLVADINPGGEGSNPDYLTVSNNTLYFSANDGVLGYELWALGGYDHQLYLPITVNDLSQE